jgi:hypothetical protein
MDLDVCPTGTDKEQRIAALRILRHDKSDARGFDAGVIRDAIQTVVE